MSRPLAPRPPLRPRLVVRRTGAGLLFALALVGGFAALALATRVYSAGGPLQPLARILVAWLIPSAWLEELLFRRLLLEWVHRLVGRWAALLVTSVLFGVAHASGPGFDVPAAVGVTLAGIWLGQLYLQQRRVIAGTAAHLGWNLGIGVLLGTPVSGFLLGGLLGFQARAGAAWSGGEFGPEASPLAWLVFAAAIAGLEIHHRWTTRAR